MSLPMNTTTCHHGEFPPCVHCQRNEIATLRQRAERAEAGLRDRKDNQDHYFMEWRGLDPDYDKICVKCGGAGRRVYGSTATWRGGIGGAAMTVDVCDRCWGSGDESKRWPSHRTAQVDPAAQSTIAELTATVERTDKERIELAKMLLHYVRSVPIGNQPHMSAEIAEKMALVALGDAS